MGSSKGTAAEKASSCICKKALAVLFTQAMWIAPPAEQTRASGTVGSGDARPDNVSYAQAKRKYSAKWHRDALSAWHGEKGGGGLFSQWRHRGFEKGEDFSIF